ncbi:MAG TPA: hypothetical protein VFC19_42060 [Candidatus Limnocylindrales bacterium]|nr:hypothetical protein [Candidatus Limnocylindrales bacterium]
MRGLRIFCLVATLAVAQVALARADVTGASTFTTLSCAMPLVTTELGPRARCTQVPASGTASRAGMYDPVSDEFQLDDVDFGGGTAAAPVGGIAIRRQESGVRIRPRSAASLTAVQMNLCNSGIAGCYTGRAGAKAAQTVLERVPALVTVNEACESDVTERLLPAMLALYPNEWIFWTFAPAAHRGSGEPVRCTPDAQGKERGRFGNGAVGRLLTEARPGFTFEGGLFPDDRPSPGELQDRAHAELRSWVCAEANQIYRACTAHLDNPSATGAGTPEQERVASNQCRYLLTSVSAGLPTVFLGDLNLGADPAARYSVQVCAPEGWSHNGDGAVQHALSSKLFDAAAVEVVPMGDTTDHPALVVVFRLRTGPSLAGS